MGPNWQGPARGCRRQTGGPGQPVEPSPSVTEERPSARYIERPSAALVTHDEPKFMRCATKWRLKYPPHQRHIEMRHVTGERSGGLALKSMAVSGVAALIYAACGYDAVTVPPSAGAGGEPIVR